MCLPTQLGAPCKNLHTCKIASRWCSSKLDFTRPSSDLEARGMNYLPAESSTEAFVSPFKGTGQYMGPSFKGEVRLLLNLVAGKVR